MKKILTILMGLLLTSATMAQSPPSGSPIALNEHPRLFFTASDMTTILDRLEDNYLVDFQAFLDLLDAEQGNQNSTSGGVTVGSYPNYNEWGAMNYAFVARLDPVALAARGFVFDTALDTAAEYCTESMLWVDVMLPTIAAGEGEGHTAVGNADISGYLSVPSAYDWCYDFFTDAEKISIIDAYNTAMGPIGANDWTNKTNQQVLEQGGDHSGLMLNNVDAVKMLEVLGIAAFSGDPLEAANTDEDFYRVLDIVWNDRWIGEMNTLYGAGWGWHEGTGGYHRDGLINLGMPLSMIGPALGRNFFTEMPFFTDYPEAYAGYMYPQGLLSQCLSEEDDSDPDTDPCDDCPTNRKCDEYLEEWGSVSDGVDGFDCLGLHLVAGRLRDGGHANAALAKYMLETVESETDRVKIGCEDIFTRYRDDWWFGVMYRFITGTKDITGTSPTALGIDTSAEHGLGGYTFRSDFTQDATMVVFWATTRDMYGHVPRTDGGPFAIYKFGKLVMFAGNSKSGRGVITDTSGLKNPGFRNCIGIHKGADDADLNWNGTKVIDPYFSARGYNSIKFAGTLLASDIVETEYDYVAFGTEELWNPTTTADLMQREFVNLHGVLDSEYLIIMDRVNTIDPANDQKLFNFWVPVQPTHENGTLPANTPKAGKTTSTDATQISVANVKGTLYSVNGSTRSFPPSHGKLYMEALLPATKTISFFGGPTLEYQDANDDDPATTWPCDNCTLNDADREILGWGRVEIKAGGTNNRDTFLNVFQMGDSNSLTSMDTVTKIDATDTLMVGAHIEDTANQWVVMFKLADATAAAIAATDYQFEHSTALSNHLVLNVTPSTTFKVDANIVASDTTIDITAAGAGTSVSSNTQGALFFNVNVGVVTAGGGSPTSPAPPTGVKVD